jgi:hypothetical protein
MNGVYVTVRPRRSWFALRNPHTRIKPRAKITADSEALSVARDETGGATGGKHEAFAMLR